jgi:transposase
MDIVPVFVGLDYHDEGIEVDVMTVQGEILVSRHCPNSWQAVAATVPEHCRVVGAAIEACCGAADFAEELIQKAGWSVDLAHPGFVSRMKQNPDKTDFGDARMLADLERVGYLPRVWLAPQEVRQLRRLVRYRQQLAGERRNLKLRIQALLREDRVPRPKVRPWTQAWLHWLTEEADLAEQSRWVIQRQLRRLDQTHRELAMTERRLAKTTAQDPVVQKLLEQKGVGLITAVTLRAEIGRFDRFRTGKQLARFCGVTPRNASSGKRQADAGLIKAGNPQLRAVLIETAHRLMRLDSRWVVLGASLRHRTRSGSVAAAAVANRWVRWLFHQMRSISQAA